MICIHTTISYANAWTDFSPKHTVNLIYHILWRQNFLANTFICYTIFVSEAVWYCFISFLKCCNGTHNLLELCCKYFKSGMCDFMKSSCIIFSEILSRLNIMLLKYFFVYQWAVFIKPDIYMEVQDMIFLNIHA